MKLLILDEEKITKFILPEKAEETCLFSYISEKNENTITIEANEGNWRIKSNGSVDIIENNIIKDTFVLSAYRYINLKINSSGKIVILYCVPLLDESLYCLSMANLTNISIGKSRDCLICYNNSLTSDIQSNLVLKNNEWYIVTNENNLVYLNDKRIYTSILNLGDRIFIYGLKIIWMNKYLIINNPNNGVLIKGLSNYKPLFSVDEELKKVPDEELVKELYNDEDYFYHTPRLKSVVIEEEVQIDPPPAKEKIDNIPAILTIGSSITMGASSLMTGYTVIYGITSGSKTFVSYVPQIIICVALIFGSLIIPRIANRYKKNSQKKKEKIRQTKYIEYLNTKEEQIQSIMKQQKQILHENNLTALDCLNLVNKKKDSIWFREIKDEDFLKIRVGVGSCSVKMNLHAPEKHFTLEEDNLYNMIDNVVSKTRKLEDIPITLSLSEKNVSAIICNCSFKDLFINSIVVQLLTLHSSLDLKLVIFTDSTQKDRWEFAKYVPHIFSDDHQMRFFASTIEDAKEVSDYLENEFKNRLNGLENAGSEGYKEIKKDSGYKNFSPYYLIINDNYKLSKNLGIINLITKEDINCGFSLMIIDDSLKNLPTSCETFVNVLDTESGIFEQEINNQSQKVFKAEYCDNIDMMKLATILLNVPVAIKDEKYELPSSISFLEMYGVSRIEQLNILNRWKQNNPVLNLAVPIGVHTNGELFKLDLHEKYHGPHGLIAGSTGSGKSEFIISYILSVAINYNPNEVQFVLIDYKGGGLAGAFENKELGIKLPHLVGTITNLDVAEMNRTLVSIDSELKRRQKLFNEVRDKLGESTIDIYKYQQFYRDGKVENPLAHLLIICDEFAELKTQQPEFMNQLISTARIGRSLGVHLILATQKPMGIVNDQIWSNTKFRVCLKVQDRADSVGVLKRPEAASIKETGRFYLQVGYDDYFDIGQSAYSGVRYIPSDRIIKKIDTSINYINDYGLIIKTVDDDIDDNSNISNVGDQLTNIVRYIIDLSTKENINTKNLWLDNIPQLIYFDDLKSKYNYIAKPYIFEAIVGEYDNPKEQEQGLLTIDVTANNTLIYGITGSGKENLLTTILYSCITNYTPSDINFYIMDFGAETLKSFNNIPHVGDVVLIEDNDKIVELFKYLSSEMEKRKELLSDFSGNFSNFIQYSKDKLPLIAVVINNYELFSESYFKISENYQVLMRDASKYGIVFIVTTSSTNSMRSRTVQYFNNRISLQLSNDSDYRLLLNAPKNLIPTKCFGRGLAVVDSNVFEFQTAFISTNDKINEKIKEFKNKANSIYSVKAKKIAVVPNIVSLENIKSYITNLSSVPVGISLNTKDICYYNFMSDRVNLILSNKLSDKIRFIKALIKEFTYMKNINIRIIDFINYFKNQPESNNYYSKNFNDGLDIITNDLNNEKNINYKNLYIFVGIGQFKEKLNNNYINKLNIIINNSDSYQNSYFIFLDSYSSYKNLETDPFIKNKINKSNGIWIGEGVGAQLAITINNLDFDDRKINFPFMGFIVSSENKEIVKCVIDEGDINE